MPLEGLILDTSKHELIKEKSKNGDALDKALEIAERQLLKDSEEQCLRGLATLLQLATNANTRQRVFCCNRLLRKLFNVSKELTSSDKKMTPKRLLGCGAFVFILYYLSIDPVISPSLVVERLVESLVLLSTKEPMLVILDDRIVAGVAELTHMSVPNVKDVAVAVDGSDEHFAGLSKALLQEKCGRFVLPIGSETFRRLMLNEELVIDEVAEHKAAVAQIQEEDRIEAERIAEEERPRTAAELEQHFVNDIILNSVKFSSIFPIVHYTPPSLEEEVQTDGVESPVGRRKSTVDQLEKARRERVRQRIEEWKKQSRDKRRESAMQIALSPQYHRHMAIRTLVCLACSIRKKSSERRKLCLEGALETLLLATVERPLHTKVAARQESQLDIHLKAMAKFTPTLAQIGAAQFQQDEIQALVGHRKKFLELKKYKLPAPRLQVQENPEIDLILENMVKYELTREQKHKSQSKALQRAKSISKNKNKSLEERLSAAKLVAQKEAFARSKDGIRAEINAAQQRRRIIKSIKRNEQARKLIESSTKAIQEGLEKDGIDYLNWVIGLPTVEERRQQKAEAEEKARQEAEHRRVVEEKAEQERLASLHERMEMVKHDKQPETEAQRRDRLKRAQLERDKREEEEKRRRELEELEKRHREKQRAIEQQECEYMRKEDLMFLEKISRNRRKGYTVDEEHDTDESFVEQAERIHRMRLRDQEQKRIQEETTLMTTEDICGRRLRQVLKEQEEKIREKELVTAKRELKQMKIEDTECKKHWAWVDEEERKAVLKRERIKAREQRAAARKKSKLEETAKREEARWETLDDGNGGNYYFNRQTGVSQYEKPIIAAREELNELLALEEQTTAKTQQEATLKVDEGVKEEPKEVLPELALEQSSEDQLRGSVLEEQVPDVGVVNWIEVDDGGGNIYYYNTVTGESRWDRPPEEAETVASTGGEWIAHEDEDGRKYYYHSITGETAWEISEA